MKHALIVAHPRSSSFTIAAADAYRAACESLGHATVTRDLYRIGFDPRLAADEIPGPDGFEPAADVRTERTLIGDCDVFAFFYPLWLNAPPAILMADPVPLCVKSLYPML